MTADPRSDAAEPDLAEVAEAIHDEIERGLAPDVRALAARFSRSERDVGELVEAAVKLRALESRARGRASIHGDLAPGTKVGDFVVEAVLGRGGMATVYLARQPALGDRAVALKVMREPSGSALVELLETEAAEASRLHHPNIAELYDFGIDGGVAYYAMRLVEGPTLAEVLDDLRAAPQFLRDAAVRRRIVRWTADVAAGLEHAHARGLVHRDVKPGNVMLARRATEGEALPDCPAILVDFGLVYSPAAAPSGLRCGTREYASPEQQEGRPPDERSDVFSLGATLHDLLTATAPNERDPAAAGLPGIDPVSSEVKADLAAIAGMATDPDPRWRFPTAAAFRRDLEAWLAGDPIAARRWNAGERALWWTRRHPLRLVLGSAAAVALALAGFGIARAMDAFEAARTARKAFDAAEPFAVVEALAGVPAVVAGVCLRDPKLAALRARVRDDGVTDPIEALAKFERDQDAQGALTYAATLLRKEGLAANDFVLRYFCNALDESAHAERRSVATSLAARLMYERPDRTDADSRASEPLREVLRARHDLADLDLLTALSGCGTTEDLDEIVESALDEAPPSERTRCALACAERILRRQHAAGHPTPLRDRTWWPRFARTGGEILAQHIDLGADPVPGLLSATEELAVAALLAERACGSKPASEALLRTEWAEAVAREQLDDRARSVPMWMAAAGDERFVPWMLGAIPETVETLHASEWGRLCGLLGDAGVTSDARRRIAELDRERPGSATAFSRALDAAIAELDGRKPDYELDESSRLEWTSEPAPFAELFVVRGPLVEPGARAAWNFERRPALVAGSATGVSITALAHERSNDSDLLGLQMAQFGRATARLEFEVERTVTGPAWIVLWHLASSRDYYPSKGTAYVEVALDGEVLDAGLAVGDFSHVTDRVRIPAGRLTFGSHTLTIRLTERSNTTYRLHKVWIE